MTAMAQARARLLRAAVTQGHVWGPISASGGHYASTCKRCSRGWVSGPTEHEIELTPCTGLRSTSAAGLACVVPGCTRQATHTVSWNHRPTGRAEAVHGCEPHARKLLFGARRSKNFRTPAITPLSPQRQKAAAFDRFQQAADSLMDRAHAQGHHVGIAWGRELLDNAARSDERHTFRCKSCGARDTLTRTPTGTWEVSHGSLTNSSCTKEKTMAVHKVAHDSGDGETIYHCPFCGSGQVMARSDRTVECEFCHTAFTVQVQPQLSAFPQTVNGAPVQVPGMPGEIGSDAPVQPDDMSAQPPGADPMDPDDLADDGQPDDAGDEGDEPMSPDDLAGDDEDEGDEDEEQQGGGFAGKPSAQNQPPWLKGNPTKRSMKTIRGAAVDEADLVRSLALRHADDRTTTLEAVRGSR